MSQPKWKLEYATDCSALYVDETGVYAPELMIAQTDDDADEDDVEATVAHVYRFPLERCWLVCNESGSVQFLCGQNPARAPKLPRPLRSYEPWYAKHLESVARSVDRSVAEITSDLCSDDPRALARAYEDIGEVEGYANFDGYPSEWTASEFAEWPDRGARLSSDERDAFTSGYVSCALWCGVMSYKHDDDCPCHEASESGDAYDSDDCECDPELDSDGDGHEESDLTEDALATLTDDAHDFYEANVVDIRTSTLDMERAGHDFWLTRRRQGAGYWDEKSRGAKADAALDRLTEAAHAHGSMDLVKGCNTKIEVI